MQSAFNTPTSTSIAIALFQLSTDHIDGKWNVERYKTFVETKNYNNLGQFAQITANLFEVLDLKLLLFHIHFLSHSHTCSHLVCLFLKNFAHLSDASEVTMVKPRLLLPVNVVSTAQFQ